MHHLLVDDDVVLRLHDLPVAVVAGTQKWRTETEASFAERTVKPGIGGVFAPVRRPFSARCNGFFSTRGVLAIGWIYDL